MSLLLRMLARLYVLDLLFWLDRNLSPKKQLLVQTYHRVVDRRKEPVPISILEGGLTIETFALHISFFKKQFNILGLDEFCEIVVNRRPIETNSLVITFDDGYHDLYENAYPVMSNNGVPATVFIATDYIESNRLFWWIRLTCIVKNLPQEHWNQFCEILTENFGSDFHDPVLDTINDEKRRTLRAKLTNHFLNMTLNERDKFLDVAYERFGHNYTLPIRVMSWSQMVELGSNGCRIEAHTHTHPELDRLDLADQLAELRTSKTTIKEKVGTEPVSVCYPSGKANEVTRQAAAAAGYKLAFTTIEGNVNHLKANFDPFWIPRISVECETLEELKIWWFKCILKKYLYVEWGR